MRLSCCSAGAVRAFVNVRAGGFFQQNLLNSFTPSLTHRNGESWNLEFRPRSRQITQPCEYKSTDGVNSFRLNLETEMFAYIVEPRVSAHEKFPVFERLDVKIDISARKRITHDFLHDIGHRDNSFGATKFIYHHRHSLGMGQEQFEQVQRAHRLGHKGGSD